MRPLDTRIPELDGLRGIAILMVVVWHFTGSLLRPELGTWALGVSAVTIFGRTGVDLFFVLSGFLIFGILIDNRESPVLFRTFYGRRIARIFPPYFLLIGCYWLCYYLTGPNSAFNTSPSFWQQFAAQALFLFNWAMAWADAPIARGFSATWSVAIEEQFYLIFPAVVLLTPTRHLRTVLISVGVSSAIARFIFHLFYPNMSLAPYILTPFRLDALCAGGLIALVWRDQDLMAQVKEARRWVFAVFLTLLATVPVLLVAISRDLFWHMYAWGHAYLAALYSAAILSVLAYGTVKFLHHYLLRFFGRISYALYLFHSLFLSLVFVVVGSREQIMTISDTVLVALALVLSVVFCWASYRVLEAPIIRLGHKLYYEGRHSSVVNAPKPT